ncbi:MAG: helicase HerA-like domain-containing protein [Thermoflexales bacterium]
MADPLLIAKGETDCFILPKMANRHGVITGATGTGKTVTLQTIAQSFSRIGVPVFVADVKGDLSGISQPGSEANARVVQRIEQLGLKDGWTWEGCPVMFWDVWGEQGHPLRATVSEMGPLLLSRILGLNETQEGVLTIIFKVADDNGLLLLDLKDLRALAQWVGDNAKELRTQYGNISAASVGAIQRGLLTLEAQGAERFFGEPALDLYDMIQTDANGRGVVNILVADRLLQSPKLYATFLLWMLSELFEQLPEVGDLDKPKLLFFFDEAHLLFDEAPKPLLDKVEQVVRIIRSKGVGVFFVTQNPIDIPDVILSQMGNRVQHALRAFTPRDQKAVRAAATTFRPNPKINTEQAITELGVGEALVSFLDEKGMPGVVERAFILPPRSQIGPITPEQRRQLISSSLVYGYYEKQLDRESAYEMLVKQAERAAEEAERAAAEAAALKEQKEAEAKAAREAERLAREQAKQEALRAKQLEREERERRRQAEREAREREKAVGDVFEAFAKSAARSLGGSTGTLMRGILGGLSGRQSRRR